MGHYDCKHCGGYLEHSEGCPDYESYEETQVVETWGNRVRKIQDELTYKFITENRNKFTEMAIERYPDEYEKYSQVSHTLKERRGGAT